MHIRAALAVLAVAVAVATAACDSSGDEGAGNTEGAAYLLRARLTGIGEPEEQFGRTPFVTINADRIVVTQSAVAASFPGPLVPSLRGRTITESGYERVVREAERLGLLDDSIARPAPAPDRSVGEIVLWAHGGFRTILGDPFTMQCVQAPCEPAPGTAEAFGAFWAGVSDLGSAMPEELGPDEAYTPSAFSLLIGVPAFDNEGLVPQVVDWPLDVPLAEAGLPIGEEPRPRCLTVRGEEAAVLAPLLASANQLTEWTDGTGGEPVVIRVHPILLGEDPCMEFFGVVPEPS